jgi:hypothetical protein
VHYLVVVECPEQTQESERYFHSTLDNNKRTKVQIVEAARCTESLLLTRNKHNFSILSSTTMSLLSPSAFLQTLDVLASSVVIGVPVWVFFLQGPLLFSFMGRDKFLSPMMRLTSLLFRWTLPTAALIVCTCTVALAYDLDSLQMLSAGFSLVAVTINATVVVPKALLAGKKATKTADKTQSPAAFAVDGGHETDTKTLHQRVVIFVVLMMGGAVTHVHALINS